MPVVAGAVVAGLTTAYGIYQTQKGKNLAKKNIKQDYEIPEEIKAKLSNAQIQALEGLPSEQKQQFIDNIQRSTQFGLNALGDRKAGISGIGALQQNEADAYNKLLAQDSMARQQNQGVVGSAQSEMAGYKDKAYGLNVLDPYKERAATSSALIGAGVQNVSSGVGGLADAYALNSLMQKPQTNLINQPTSVQPQANLSNTPYEGMNPNTAPSFEAITSGINNQAPTGLNAQELKARLMNDPAFQALTPAEQYLKLQQLGLR